MSDELSVVRSYFGPDSGGDDSSSDRLAETPEAGVEDSGDDQAWFDAPEGAYGAASASQPGSWSFAELEAAFESASEPEREAWLASLSASDRGDLLDLRDRELAARHGQETAVEKAADEFLAERAGRGADTQALRRVADTVFERWVAQGHTPTPELAVQALEVAAQAGRHSATAERALRRA
jgi:hypothetical protein